jgi:hypothetical protein
MTMPGKVDSWILGIPFITISIFTFDHMKYNTGFFS